MINCWKIRCLRISVMLSLATVALASCSHQDELNMSGNIRDGGSQKNLGDNHAIGIALRSAIDVRFKELSDKNSIKTAGTGRNDISDLVLIYIPVGTTFQNAQEILRSAGFTVGAQEKIQFPPYLVVNAQIDHYVATPLGKTSIAVLLQPMSANDWTKVRIFSAEITRRYI